MGLDRGRRLSLPWPLSLPLLGHGLALVLTCDNKHYVNSTPRNLLIAKRNRNALALAHVQARRPAHPPPVGRKGPISRVRTQPKRPPGLALDRVLAMARTVTLSLSINRLWLRARKIRMFSRRIGRQKGGGHDSVMTSVVEITQSENSLQEGDSSRGKSVSFMRQYSDGDVTVW
jgi:hypothetical protein